MLANAMDICLQLNRRWLRSMKAACPDCVLRVLHVKPSHHVDKSLSQILHQLRHSTDNEEHLTFKERHRDLVWTYIPEKSSRTLLCFSGGLGPDRSCVSSHHRRDQPAKPANMSRCSYMLEQVCCEGTDLSC